MCVGEIETVKKPPYKISFDQSRIHSKLKMYDFII